MPISYQSIAKKAIYTEANSIHAMSQFINEEFEQIITQIKNCKGRLVVTGIGKSALIAQKIVATFNSTGTPALYMHASEAIHGDLGMIQKKDIVLMISKSGESPEIKFVVPFIKKMGNTIIGMVGNVNSFLAKQSDYILNTTIQQEVCPHNLAPTTSTTAQLVMGDALAIVLMKAKGFNKVDFARYHPGGNLGKQLLLQVSDIAKLNEKPAVYLSDSLQDIIIEISKKRLGATAVLDKNEKVVGIITDGDLRRMMNKKKSMDNIIAKDIYTAHPKYVTPNTSVTIARDILRKNGINQLLIVEKGKLYGMVHLQDFLREGIH